MDASKGWKWMTQRHNTWRLHNPLYHLQFHSNQSKWCLTMMKVIKRNLQSDYLRIQIFNWNLDSESVISGVRSPEERIWFDVLLYLQERVCVPSVLILVLILVLINAEIVGPRFQSSAGIEGRRSQPGPDRGGTLSTEWRDPGFRGGPRFVLLDPKGLWGP